MQRNIFTSSLPLIIICIICGFVFHISRQTKLQAVLNIYCLVVTMLYSVLWVLYFSITLYSMDYTYNNCLGLCLSALESICIIYYMIIFYRCKEANCHTLCNITYIDHLLGSLNVAVPHAQNAFECIIIIIIYYILNIIYAYRELHNVSFGNQTFDFMKMYYMICTIIIESITLLCFFLIYIIRQRVQLARCAAENFDKVSDRNVAWSSQVSVRVVTCTRSGNFLTEVCDSYQVVCSIYRCIYDTVLTVRQLYAAFLCQYICGIIVWYSVDIINNTTDWSRETFLFVTAANLFVDIIHLFLCHTVASELRGVQIVLTSFYYKRELQNLRYDTKLLICEIYQSEERFDCGLFVVDLKSTFMLYHFITLLTFSTR